jgi:hypothetical protein
VHKYYWINKKRNKNSADFIYFITTSLQYHDPETMVSDPGQIVSRDTISIQRNGRTAKNIFIFGIEGPLKNE